MGECMKEEFKRFVRNNPNLASFVEDKKMTWQQFYELYDLYGESSNVWDKFTKIENSPTTNSNLLNTIREIVALFKGIDLETVQKALTTADKAIEAVKGFSKKDQNVENNYQERPKYKYFED